MRLYRIGPYAFLENCSGLGASYRDGGRWNHAGTPVLYFALSPAVALLEMGNYLPSPRLVPGSYRLGIYHLPKTVACDELPQARLPDDWAAYPYPASTQALGTQLLKDGNSAVLLVPSAAVPAGLERIAVVNPLHPDTKHLRLLEMKAELYNNRAFQGV